MLPLNPTLFEIIELCRKAFQYQPYFRIHIVKVVSYQIQEDDLRMKQIKDEAVNCGNIV